MSITTTIHTEMRRQDRAVDDPTIIKAFLHRCKMVTLAIHDEPFPYIVPLSYGYEVNDDGLIFYFHGAAEGHKVDLYEKNPGDLRRDLAMAPYQIAANGTEKAWGKTAILERCCGKFRREW